MVLVNYNIPPWKAIKKGHVMLALLIPGKHKVENMDVYLESLIEEFMVLQEGVAIHDMSRPLD